MRQKRLLMRTALPTVQFPSPMTSSPPAQNGSLRALREFKKKLRMALV